MGVERSIQNEREKGHERLDRWESFMHSGFPGRALFLIHQTRETYSRKYLSQDREKKKKKQQRQISGMGIELTKITCSA